MVSYSPQEIAFFSPFKRNCRSTTTLLGYFTSIGSFSFHWFPFILKSQRHKDTATVRTASNRDDHRTALLSSRACGPVESTAGTHTGSVYDTYRIYYTIVYVYICTGAAHGEWGSWGRDREGPFLLLLLRLRSSVVAEVSMNAKRREAPRHVAE